MRKAIVVAILLLGIVVFGCTSPPPETTVQPSTEPPSIQTEQQILAEHPDNLDQALEELELVG